MNSDPNQSANEQPTEHSDNEKSKLPERDDEGQLHQEHDRNDTQGREGCRQDHAR